MTEVTADLKKHFPVFPVGSTALLAFHYWRLLYRQQIGSVCALNTLDVDRKHNRCRASAHRQKVERVACQSIQHILVRDGFQTHLASGCCTAIPGKEREDWESMKVGGIRHVLKKQVGLSLIGWRVVYFCAFSCVISCYSILLYPSLCPFKKEAGSDRLKSKPPSWIIPESAKKEMGVDEAH